MKKSYTFLLFIICSLSPSLLLAQHKSITKNWTTSNPFKTDVFIENFGQYNNWINSSDVIKYAINNSEKIFFLPNGIIYRLDVVEKTDEQELGKSGEKDEDEIRGKIHTYYVKMLWDGCNANLKIETSDESQGYYTFGEKGYENIKAKGFKTILYKDLYPGIDVEYTIVEKGGIKYKLIVHSGADFSKVKMKYSGDFEEIKKDKDGNILIETPKGNIIDHAPNSFYEESNTSIQSAFEINNNTISFNLKVLTTPDSKLQTIVIDPWVIVPTALITNSIAYDIAVDDYGDVYVAGGVYPFMIAKYSNIGTLIWTFTEPIGWGNGMYYSKFCILPNSGTAFMGEGFDYSGPQVIKISPSGALLVTSPYFGPNNEIWSMFYNRCTGQLIAFGGGTAYDYNLHVIADTNLTSATSSDFNAYTGTDNDIASAKMDNNGDFYSLMVSIRCADDNHLMKSLLSSGYTPPTAFDVNTSYGFVESENLGIPGLTYYTVRANAMALNINYLFTYDGKTLDAWDKTSGSHLGSIIVDPSYAAGVNRTHEGIVVDECNNVYVGGTNKVHEYSFSGSTFTPVTIYTTEVPNQVYDICLDETSDNLYVCGYGFVSTFPVTSCPVVVGTLSISTSVDSCINSATVNVITGTPPYTYLWSNGNTSNTISGVSSGTYFVTVTDYACTRENRIDTVIINSPNSMHICNDTTICSGSSVVLSVNGAHSYIWSPSTGLSSVTDSIVTATPADTIIYTVTGTFPNGCTESLPVTVNIANLHSITVSNDTAICNGDSVMLHANGGSVFNWSPTVTLNNVTISNPLAYPTSTTIYYVTVSNGGCSKYDSIKVTVHPVPIVTATSSIICSGQTITLFAGGATSYIWNDGSTNSFIIVNPTSTTVYTVTGTSSGCKATATGTVTVNPLPNAQISPFTPTTCGLNNGTATATGGITYLWSNGQTTAIVTGLAAGNYTVTVTDSNGCSATAGVTINLIPTVTVALLSIDSVKCFGQANGSISVNASSGTPGYIYNWSNGQNSSIASNLIVGTYTVTVTDASGCTSSTNATVQQPLLLTSVVASADSILMCYGMNNGYINLAVAGGTPSYNYLWNTGATGTSINSLSGGTYTFTVTDRNGCTSTTSVTITQPPDLVLSISSFTNVSCFGGSNGSAIVNVTGGVTPYASYNWDDGETNAAAVNLNVGIHSVTVTDANGCSKTITVTITQPSQIHMSSISDSVKCYGQNNGEIDLTITGGTPSYNCLWSTGLGGTIASNLAAGAYSCVVTDANNCKDSLTATVLQPTQLISTVTNADTILPCWGLNNGTITIAVVGGTRPWTFLWNTGATGMTINNLTGGTYTDTITDSKGCRNIHTVVVTQPTQLFVQMDSIPVSCLNNCDGQLTSAVTGGTPWHGTGGLTIYHYLWNTVPPQSTETITGLCEGTYNLTITDSNGCSRIISEYIGVNDSVVANLVAAPTTGYIPLDVNFNYTGTSSSANLYTWNFGDGGISSLENPTHLYTTADTFSVWLYITNGICKDSIHIFVYPEIPSLLIVPNVFTPNGDGYNDEFMVKYQNIKTFNCMIFDRWGKKMYEWDDVTKGWDGKTKGGAECSDGTYYYILSAEGVDGIKYNDHGTVTLLR